MACSVAVSRSLLSGSLALQGPQSREARSTFTPAPQGSLQESSFLAGWKAFGLETRLNRVAGGRKQTIKAAIVPERAAETRWEQKRKALMDNKVRSVPPREARRLIEEQGYRMLDVRPDYEYKDVHPTDSSNVQIYRLIQDWTPYKIVRRAGFAFFGIFKGTEENPEFIQQVRAAFPDKQAGVIVACSQGGTTRPSANFPEGKQSRSLIAAYYLVADGYKNVLHLEDGLYGYFQAELPAVFANDN